MLKAGIPGRTLATYTTGIIHTCTCKGAILIGCVMCDSECDSSSINIHEIYFTLGIWSVISSLNFFGSPIIFTSIMTYQHPKNSPREPNKSGSTE